MKNDSFTYKIHSKTTIRSLMKHHYCACVQVSLLTAVTEVKCHVEFKWIFKQNNYTSLKR